MDMLTRFKILKIYYQCNRSDTMTLREYKKRHSMKNNPLTLSPISKTISKFKNSGSINNMPKSGRPSLASQRAPMVSEQLSLLKRSNRLMIATASQIAGSTNILIATINRILKYYLKLYPYKILISQTITESDMSQQMEFAQFIFANMKMLDNILWND